MTNEEKQALIEWLKAQIHELEILCDEIPFGLDADDAMHLQVMRIALASLQTVQVGEMVRFTDRVTGAVSEWKLSKNICGNTEGFQYKTETKPIYDAPPFSLAELVPVDYFGELVLKARTSANKAMLKFPQPNYVLLKVAEEAGEVVQAGVHYAENRMTWQEVEGEIVQLLAMLIRLVTEGDQVNGITPPEACHANIVRSVEEAGLIRQAAPEVK